MTPFRKAAYGLALLAGAASIAATARPLRYALPEEQAPILPPDADSDLVAAHCAACHSLDYLTTQPRGKGAQFWRDAVAKMVSVYGAPVPPEDAERIGAYLARHYGPG
ncbi:sulfite:cytochrome C oxidoreductase subunit B [soil metagenome]